MSIQDSSPHLKKLFRDLASQPIRLSTPGQQEKDTPKDPGANALIMCYTANQIDRDKTFRY